MRAHGKLMLGWEEVARAREEEEKLSFEVRSAELEIEEYSHFGMVARYTAGAMNLPFFPLRSYFETDMPTANPLIRQVPSAASGLRGANFLIFVFTR